MGQTRIRVAAAIAAVAVFVMAGGAGAGVAAAEPGGPRSPYSHSGDGPRHDLDDRRGHRRGDGDRWKPGPYGTPRGSGKRGGPTPGASAGRPTAVAEPATTARVAALAPVTEGLGPEPSGPPAAASGGGSSITGVPTPPVVVPRVTFGNGRSPVFEAVVPEARPAPVVARQPPVVAVPSKPAPVPVVASSALTMRAFPWPLPEAPAPAPAAAIGGELEPGWFTAALSGLAGLLMAPVAGAWLGYRQARASRAAAQLVVR